MSETKELVKLDAGKAPLDFLPLKYLAPMAWVMRGGAKKYSRGGWEQGKPEDVQRYIAAVLRHLGSVEAGEQLDQESGLPHLAHAACSMVMACGLALKHKVLGFADGWQNGKGFWS